ncbi:unnamed protein product [Leptidea sinapis]|uniref:Uncharacterized protein n=1 Tax=Leptidea sinapis TaxID=189913 RepID=A0A5E4QW13_9NEOP|nr:unnamed protein product [Leptidea sinapis]
MPQPAANRAVRLPDGHEECYTKTEESPPEHKGARILRSGDSARDRGRSATSLLSVLQHHLRRGPHVHRSYVLHCGNICLHQLTVVPIVAIITWSFEPDSFP